MQRHPQCALAHAQRLRGITCRSSFDGNQSHDTALPLVQGFEHTLHVMPAASSAVTRASPTRPRRPATVRRAAPATHHVDQLVAADCRNPRRDRLIRAPGVALQVNCQQGFLHHILHFLHLRFPSAGSDCASCPATRQPAIPGTGDRPFRHLRGPGATSATIALPYPGPRQPRPVNGFARAGRFVTTTRHPCRCNESPSMPRIACYWTGLVGQRFTHETQGEHQ